MLKGISWEDYLTWAGTILILYYAVVLFIYRKKSPPVKTIADKAPTKKIWHVEETDQQPEDQPASAHERYFPDDTATEVATVILPQEASSQEEQDLHRAELILDSVIASFDRTSGPARLLELIAHEILIHPELSVLQYRQILARLIVNKAWELQKIVLSEDDIASLWQQ